jgi:threonine dehydratase
LAIAFHDLRMSAGQDPVVNGVNATNGHVHTNGRRTPSMSGLSLTEYSANPSPPSARKQTSIKQLVPDELLLPNGHPDVWPFLQYSN